MAIRNPYRAPQSRLARKQIRVSYQRITMATLGIILLLSLLVLGGIPALLKITAFITEIRGGSETIISEGTGPLLPPQLEPLPPATNSAKIAIRGSTQAGATIEIFLNDESREKVVADSDGNFLVLGLFLAEGENAIKTQSANQAGAKSQFSNTLFITYKVTPPPLEIFEPSEGTVYSKENKEIKVRGKTDPGNSLTVNGRWVIVDSDGSFSHILGLSPGENLIKIVATDKAGNQTTTERKVTYNP